MVTSVFGGTTAPTQNQQVTPGNMDWLSYINQNPDLQSAGLKSEADALWHWNTYGKNEGRQFFERSADAPLGMMQTGSTYTNRPGTGLDAQGNLLPGWKYVTYNNDGTGAGTPINVAAAVNVPGSQYGHLTGLTAQNYAQHAQDPTVKANYTQVANRTSPGAVIGGTPARSGGNTLPNLFSGGTSQMAPFSTGVPGTSGYTQYPSSGGNNLWSMFPRRRAAQNFSRGSRYFSPITGNYMRPW